MAHTDLPVIDSISGKTLPVNIVHAGKGHVIAFLVLSMWPAFLGLPILLATIALSKTVSRHATFINQCVVYILIGLASSLLLLTGQAFGAEPERMFCLFQACLQHGMPPMASMATLMLVLQMFLKFRSAHYGIAYNDADHRIRTYVMVILPYVTYFAFVLATAVIGAGDPSRISRDRRVFYCSVEHNPLTDTLTSVSAVILLAAVVLEVWSVVLLLKQRVIIKKAGGDLRGTLDLNFSIRIIAFGLYILAAMCLCVLSVTSPSSPIPDLAVASGASVIILIFGTQPDILHALCFWRNWERSPFYKPSPLISLQPSPIAVDLKHAFDPEAATKKVEFQIEEDENDASPLKVAKMNWSTKSSNAHSRGESAVAGYVAAKSGQFKPMGLRVDVRDRSQFR